MSSFEIYQNIQIQQKLKNAYLEQQRNKLTKALSGNNHTLIALTSNEYLNLIGSIQRSQGYTHQQTLHWLDKIVNTTSGVTANTKNIWHKFKATWSKYSDTGKSLASYWPVFDDSLLLGALALELKRGGNIFSKYKVVTYPRQTFILLYSDPALRKHLTRNIFIASNPKIVNMGIGKLGALNTIKTGGIFTVIFSIAFHGIDQLMRDQLTWHHFVGGVAVDVVLAAAATGIIWGLVALSMGTAAMLAVGPLIIIVVGGGVLATFFNNLSKEYQLVNKVADLLIEAEERNKRHIAVTLQQLKRSLTYADEDPQGFMHRLIAIPYLTKSISSQDPISRRH
jgi:hypothetical protein